MKESIRKGCSFGLTSGIITTLGTIIGLNSGTHSKFLIIIGITIIAIADALSDAFGIHVSEESTTKKSEKAIWESTIATFLSKTFFAFTFIIPILLFKLSTAITVSLAWGFLLIILVSIQLAKIQKVRTSIMISKHLAITIVVILVTHFVGTFLSSLNF